MLSGHVVSTMVRTTLGLVAVIGVAFLLGFNPTGSVLDWLAAGGVLLLVVFAVSWLTVAFGLAAKTPESAGFSTMPLIMLPFFSSAIVPADKMGAGIREFAHYQPFTSIIESIRGFLIGARNTGQTLAAIDWSLAIALIGYIWAQSKFNTQA